ncbi:MAG: MotA/TolQ/ExbB proton channel family protein [Pseudomonadota bacterium]
MAASSARIDLNTFISIVLTFGMIAAGIAVNGSLLPFLYIPSISIVVGGTFTATLACFNFMEVMRSHITIVKGVLTKPPSVRVLLVDIYDIAMVSYKNGFLALENEFNNKKVDPNFREICQMLIDDAPKDFIERNIKQKMFAVGEESNKVVEILRKAAEIAPSMGLIGTLIGLVQMLGALDDVSTVGPAMAVALLTTFYGAVLAYMIFNPLASKLEFNSKQKLLIWRVYYESVLSMAKKQNPRQLETVINNFLPKDQQLLYFD